jgi:hypothetical protein
LAIDFDSWSDNCTVIAGFFTGGALAIRGGRKAAFNSAIACGCLLAVIEGVGIGFQRMMADNTKLEVGKELAYELSNHALGTTASSRIISNTGYCLDI